MSTNIQFTSNEQGEDPVMAAAMAAEAKLNGDAGVQVDPGDDPPRKEEAEAEEAARAEAAKAAKEGRDPQLPEKFKSVEDLAKAYRELEQRQGSKPTQLPKIGESAIPTPKPGEEPAKGTVTPEELAALTDEFAQKGQLTDESYTKLTERGIPRPLVDQYIAGQMALGEQRVAQVLDAAGGKDNYLAMIQWADANLNPAEKASFNESVQKGDIGRATFAVRGLAAQFTQARGQTPQLLKGRPTSGDGPAPFRDIAEWESAVNDPRYDKSEAFRKDVIARLERSNIL